MFAKLFARIKSLIQYIRENRFDRSLMRYFDWPLLIMVLTISLFGIVCIFSATSSEVSTAPSNLVEMLQTQSIAYPRLQFLWLLAGMVAMFAIIFFPYALYGRYAALAARHGNLHLLGRLAEYKYYNMDAIVARALALSDDLLK